MRTKFLRTKYLTGSHIQMKYLGLLMLSMIVPLLFVGGCLYYLIFSIMAEQIGIPEYIAHNMFPVISKVNMILLIGVPPLFLLLMFWGVVLSHRFAGPLQRLERELHKITHSGDLSHRINLRKGDDVKPLADAINKLLDSVHKKTKVHGG